MVRIQKITSVLQIACAALGVPAAAAGSYTAYRSFFSPAASCQALRASLLATVDRALPPESIRALMKKDLATFKERCATGDPDAMAAFMTVSQPVDVPSGVSDKTPATAQPGVALASSVSIISTPTPTPTPTPVTATGGAFASIPIGVFGVNAAGETKGWIALDRRDPDHFGETSFDGYDVGKPVAVSAVLRARWAVPVWREVQPPGAPDISRVQGRLAAGQCVRILSVAPRNGPRPWAAIELASCAGAF